MPNVRRFLLLLLVFALAGCATSMSLGDDDEDVTISELTMSELQAQVEYHLAPDSYSRHGYGHHQDDEGEAQVSNLQRYMSNAGIVLNRLKNRIGL